jgi:hypothetical protein
VLDAVSDSSRILFERHLSGCAVCAREVIELREVTAELARGAATEPPLALIERVRESVRQVAQLPPIVDSGVRWIDRPRSTRTRRRLARPMLPRPMLPRPMLPRLAGGLAAILIAAVAVVSAVAQHAVDEVSAAQERIHQIAQVLNAPDAIMFTSRVATGGTVTVIMSDEDHSLVFTTAGLRRLPASRCYQLWLMGPAGDRSAGMLPSPRDGMTSPVVASGIRAGDHVGLTIEPDGGTSHPTGAPIMVLLL